MNEKEKPYRLRFGFNKDKANLRIIKLLQERQPLTGEELRKIILDEALTDKDFLDSFRASVDYLTLDLLHTGIIEGDWRREETRAIKEYSLTVSCNKTVTKEQPK